MAAPTAPITPKGGINHLQVEHLSVADEAYGPAWDGSLKVPTKNATYDAITALNISGGSWTPVVTGGGSMTVGALSIFQADYLRVGNAVTISLFLRFTLGGGAHYGINVTPPFPVAGSPGDYVCAALQNGVRVTPYGLWRAGNPMLFFKDGAAAWTLGPNAEVAVNGTYRAA